MAETMEYHFQDQVTKTLEFSPSAHFPFLQLSFMEASYPVVSCSMERSLWQGIDVSGQQPMKT
jgi:hypothetical protein